MAKKKATKKSSPFGKYRDTIISAAEGFVEREIGNFVDWIKGMTKIKQKIKKTVTFVILTTAGATIILYGLARLLMDYFPGIRDGTMYIIVGILAIIAGLLYKKS